MGAACSAKRRAEAEVDHCQMVLLGAANVGKSTVFKQMILLRGAGFSAEERSAARDQIIENVLEMLQALDGLAEEDIAEENADLMDTEIRPVLLNYRGRDPNKLAPPVSENTCQCIRKQQRAQGRLIPASRAGS